MVQAIRPERPRIGRVVAIAGGVVVLDQIVKLIALDRLTLGVPVDVIQGLVALTLVKNPGLAFGLLSGLIFGGAVGNLIDRTRLGAVVDFVDVHFRGWHWPAFNVADSAITVGVAMLALGMLADRSPSAPA